MALPEHPTMCAARASDVVAPFRPCEKSGMTMISFVKSTAPFVRLVALWAPLRIRCPNFFVHPVKIHEPCTQHHPTCAEPLLPSFLPGRSCRESSVYSNKGQVSCLFLLPSQLNLFVSFSAGARGNIAVAELHVCLVISHSCA